MNDDSRALTATLDRKAWLNELKKRGLKDCRWPRDIDFGGTMGEAIVTLKEIGIGANMQSDAAAFEAWSLALRVYCGAMKVRVELESGLEQQRERQAEKHVERFLYRLGRFDQLFGVDANDYARHAKAFAGTPIVNVPLNQRPVLSEKEFREKMAAILLTAKEDDLEKLLEISPGLKEAFARENPGGMKTMRQLPVGLFDGKINESKAIFTGGKSAIDLIGVEGSTLLLFELKKEGNCKAGALSETFFYASVMRDVLRGKFAFEKKPSKHSYAITAQDILQCTDIRAVIVAPRLHPLIDNRKGPAGPGILDSLNDAARLHWTEMPVHFEAWTFKVNAAASDFDFTRVAG